MGVFHRPGFGLLGSVPRSLSTQPPFATQALNVGKCNFGYVNLKPMYLYDLWGGHRGLVCHVLAFEL